MVYGQTELTCDLYAAREATGGTIHHELIYAGSDLGFALCSMRNENLSRFCVQCPLPDKPEGWSDDAFWTALRQRIPARHAEALVTGPHLEKSSPIAQFRL